MRVLIKPVAATLLTLSQAITTSFAEEAKPLAELVGKKHRGPKPIGDLLIPLLIRLGVCLEEEVESTTSEARSSD